MLFHLYLQLVIKVDQIRTWRSIYTVLAEEKLAHSKQIPLQKAKRLVYFYHYMIVEFQRIILRLCLSSIFLVPLLSFCSLVTGGSRDDSVSLLDD